MFNSSRLKINLKLCINRLKLLRAKNESLSINSRKAISNLMLEGKLESAKIRVEGIIRDDDLREVMEMLELYCELLLARFGLLEPSGPLDPSLIEAVHGLVYSCPRITDAKELTMIRDQFLQKLGKETVLAIIANEDDQVHSKIVYKLAATPPSPLLIEKYIEEIGIRYGVPGYAPQPTEDDVLEELIEDENLIELENAGSDQKDNLVSKDQNNIQAPSKKVTTTTKPHGSEFDSFELPSPPKTSNSQPQKSQPKPQAPSKAQPQSTTPTLDELNARFLALKRG